MKLYFPRAPAASPAVVPAPVAALPLERPQERTVILVVEDDPAVAKITVGMLQEIGYEILSADGPDSALRFIEMRSDIALMLSDVIMPGMNGRVLAEKAKLIRPEMKVLFTTGCTRNAIVHGGVLDPAFDLIGKPFTMEGLARKLRQLLVP